ncbi:cyanase [Alkalihalobacterium elongatum]|uniref:cyanase n=1 Tax=Alkalihalobacterium elongatum TaxID=2675466 RepID=UPI001C1F9D20|nr:cyanase [Alkalihalobacterium elongatum]
MFENGPYNEFYTRYRADQAHPISSFNDNREVVTQILLTAKKNLQLTFEQIAQQIGGSKEWIAAVILGQESMKAEDALKLTTLLQVSSDITTILQEPPMRGSLNRTLPIDPLIYRFYEITQVYGTTFKALINEMFGDGIMSAIDLKIKVDKQPDPEDPESERVVITFDGKYLPYKKW